MLASHFNETYVPQHDAVACLDGRGEVMQLGEEEEEGDTRDGYRKRDFRTVRSKSGGHENRVPMIREKLAHVLPSMYIDILLIKKFCSEKIVDNQNWQQTRPTGLTGLTKWSNRSRCCS